MIHLDFAWTCIKKEYLSLAKKTAMTEGPGVSIFKMLRREATEDSAKNCEYYYFCKDGSEDSPWGRFMSNLDSAKDVVKSYDSDKHFLVCVSIDSSDSTDSTLCQVRLFDLDTSEEVSA